MLDSIKKGITVNEIKRAVTMTEDMGIETQCSFIVGMPQESVNTLHETQKLITEMSPARAGWCFACPFPGTEFDREVTEKGYKNIHNWDEYGYGYLYCRTDYLTIEELRSFPGFRN
jgi:radical SAM superfamily enzyme YgiQ (UPF0313 family)